MRLFLFFLLFPFFSSAQLGVVAFGDTIKSFDPESGIYTQINKQVPSMEGQSGKFLSNNGSGYLWIIPDYAPVSHSHAIADVTGLQTALDGKQASLGFTAVPNTRTVNGQALSSDVTITTISGNAGTATALQTSRNINGISFNGSTDVSVDNDYAAYAALGSAIVCETVQLKLKDANTSTALVDGQVKWTAIYLPKPMTLTGLKVYVRTQGSYTGDNNNRIGLYSYSGGTLTLVASNANNASLWTSAANAVQTIPFSSTYVAQPGIYFTAILYNNSVQTTAPTLATGTAANNAAMMGTAFGFTNSAKLHGTSNATDLPASIAMSSITASTTPTWTALY